MVRSETTFCQGERELCRVSSLILAGLVDGKARYIMPVLVLSIFRVIVGLTIFRAFVSDLQSTVFPWYTAYHLKGYLGQIPPYDSWLYLFSGWDTQFYVAIAKNGYFEPLYAFLPAYPILIKALAFVLRDQWLAASFISLLFGTLSLPIFQLIAEDYYPRRESLCCTLVFGFFPYVFLFTTVAYTESLFIFFTLASWLLYTRGNHLSSSLACTVASLTKIYGIVALVPIFADLIVKRDHKKILYITLPFAALGAWSFYRFLSTGYWIAPPTAQSPWAVYGLSFSWIRFALLPVTQAISGDALATVGFVVLITVLTISAFHLDWRLGAYSIIMLMLLLAFGTIQSLPRFLSFIYPVWLVPRFRSLVPLIILLTLFAAIDLKFWYTFITANTFIG